MELITLIGLGAITYISSSIMRKKHNKELAIKETELLNIPITTISHKKDPIKEAVRVELIRGSVVLSVSYFEQLLSSLKNFFGGQISVFEEIMTRARREAIVRMKEQGKSATMIANVRLETSEIGRNQVEVIAYGTAIYK